MGYYSRHVIKFKDSNDRNLHQKLRDTIEEISGYNFKLKNDNSIDDSNWNGGDGCKWYEYHIDMPKISERFKDHIIYIWKQGEDFHESEFLYCNGKKISMYTHEESHDWRDYYDDDETPNIHEHDYGILKDNPLKETIVGDEIKRFK